MRRTWRDASPGVRGLAVSGAVAAVVAAVVAVAVVRTPDTTPTVPEARAQVSAAFDRIIETFAAADIVERSETLTEEPCPVAGRGDLVSGQAWVILDHAVNAEAWATSLARALPPSEGWHISASQLSAVDAPLDLTIVGRDLSIVEARLSVNGESPGLAMTATSQCTAP